MQGVDRRSAGRFEIGRGALLFFDGRPGMSGCCIADISVRGAKLLIYNMPVLPIAFKLTFDNFVTTQRCRLIWRDRDHLGVIFKN
jgi:hypothetical protein